MEHDADLRDRVLTPRRMGHIADQLEEAIGALEVSAMSDWRIRIPPDTRLPEIVRRLREAAAEESFPECPSQRALIAQAARDAQEFAEISWVLPVDALRPLRQRLQKAVFGTLGQTRQEAYQAQSELWTGAVLARSGALTGVRISDEGKSPDFILRNGTEEYAVEVKRPTNPPRALDLVSKAAGQLRNDRYHGGAIVVDLTDCLGSKLGDLSGRGRPRMDEVEAKIKELTNPLRKQVFGDSSGRIQARYHHIFALVMFTRAIWWDLDDLSQMHPLRHVLSIRFWHGIKDLRYWRAGWLAELIDKGIGETGHQGLGKREITFDA
ncbi:MAG: hypothetical protein OXE73_02120 [Gammaproteobacteria bacterium]|nr:hypothetical protein [Gammaproteobacteria bacterium]